MITKEKNLFFLQKKKNKIVSFDVEWTKNYRIKKGNKSFCFSLVFFDNFSKKLVKEEDIRFGFQMAYAQNLLEIKKITTLAEEKLSFFLKNNFLFIGHQLCSDLSVLRAYGSQSHNLIKLQKIWKRRKSPNYSRLFDSRFDIKTLKNKSRRLVDVCEELNLIVTQPELKGSSMTSMQNNFYNTKEKLLYEKIAVLNIRHSLSTGLIYLLLTKKIKWLRKINVNQILYNNIKDDFSYINSPEFIQLLDEKQ